MTSSSPIRLLLVCPEPFTHRGGVSRIVERLMIGLPDSIEISLACPDGRTDGLAAGARRPSRILSLPEGKWTAESARNFSKAIAEGEFDLLNFHDGGSFGYSLHIPWRSPLHRLPAATAWIYSNHCVHGFGYFLPPDCGNLESLLKRTVAWLSKARALQRCRAEVFDSHENENRMRNWFPFWSRRLRTIYHSGLVGPAPQPTFRDPAVTIGNLGHIARRKGQPDLFAAFRALAALRPELRLVLMGDDGSDGAASALREAVRASGLGDRVHFRDGSSSTAAFWNDIDIYVQPSHYEGLPMSLTEAMWHGKPCVATNVSGIPEIVQHDVNGLLCPARAPDQLAQALDRLLGNAPLRGRLGRVAQQSVLRMDLTLEHMCRSYADLYREVISK